MTTNVKVEAQGKLWVTKIYYGSDVEVCGPYRFKWIAKIVAWIFDGIH